MPAHKRRYISGKVAWYFKFQAPGATRLHAVIIREHGFATKKEAEDVESIRRSDELKKYDLARAGATGVAAKLPTTLSMLLEEFFRQHVDEKLAPKTIERYHEMAACLAPELLAMPLGEITPLHLNREWTRLLKSGGHHRRTKPARPLSTKTVRNIAGVVSSAFGRAVHWGLVATNPVTNSEPPVPREHIKLALLPAEQMVMIDAAGGHGSCLRSWICAQRPARAAARSWLCAGRTSRASMPPLSVLLRRPTTE
jgi:hypothetical protein